MTGVRGVGKTTTARIIARSLNCVHGPTVTPCGTCEHCVGIANDRHVDVMEMDAASRTGVDDIREILDGVRYGPASARYKIYIIDEVHMLSKNAFNALLKTLEEPPAHTKFIFATTEIRKVPVTVLSRCQRFDLRRVDESLLAKHFADVTAKEKATFEPAALALIARAADGSVRDGLSLLDQAIARGQGNVTTTEVSDMLGYANRADMADLTRAILKGDMPRAAALCGQMNDAGADPLQILQDLADNIHLLSLMHITDGLRAAAHLSEIERNLGADLAVVSVPALARAWQILLKGITEVQGAMRPVAAAEMVIIRLAYAAQLPTPGDLVKKLKDMGGTATVSGKNDGHSGGDGPSFASEQPQARRESRVVSQQVMADPLPQTAPEVRVALAPIADYRTLVALFSENREGALHAYLYNTVRWIRLEPGILEIEADESLPQQFAARVAEKLSMFRGGERWFISISSKKAGHATLAEEDATLADVRRQKILAHPMVQSLQKHFPTAKWVAHHEPAPLNTVSEEAQTDHEEGDDV
jgi:DNA polymerase III subunit gamma/tau